MCSAATEITLINRAKPLVVNANEEEISVLSWNVLADRHLQGQYKNNNPDYMHVGKDMLSWSNRSSIMINEMISSEADVICLQECEDIAFKKDFEPQLGKAGYNGLMQQQKASGDGTKFDIGVATFWKRDKLLLVGECHRSRTMVTVFNYITQSSHQASSCKESAEEEQDKEASLRPPKTAIPCKFGGKSASYGIGVVNCHLQGRPDLTTTRVKQLQSSLKELATRFSHHAVLVVGDFNCCLQDSACSGYLAFGTVPQHQTEWGYPVPPDACLVPAHGYENTAQFTAAVSPNTSQGDFTFCTRPNRTADGLDQIWFSSSSLELIGMRSHFINETDKSKVVNITGMPCAINPSDHVPIASVFKWRSNKELVDFGNHKQNSLGHDQSVFKNQNDSMNETDPDMVREAALNLLMACPISDEEREEFEITLLPFNGGEAQKKGKPSQAEIDYYQHQRLRKESLLSQVSDEAKQMLEAVLKLRRKAEKLQQQKLKNDRKKNSQKDI